MPLEFTRPLANAKDFRAPLFAFDAKPAAGETQLTREMLPYRENHPQALLFLRARYGLACIAKALLNDGATVLLPAYHCPAMIEPFVWAGCTPEFYDVDPTSLLPVEAVRDQFNAADAILLSHFCYPRRELRVLADEARAADLLVIEDLAHAGLQNTLLGDVGVTSLVKFLPVPFGGEVISANIDSARAVADQHRRLQFSATRWYVGALHRRLRQRLIDRPAGDNSFRYFDPHAMTKPMQVVGSQSMSADEAARHALLRSSNFSLLNEFFGDRYPTHYIDPGLVGDATPYAFPLLMPNEAMFAELKQHGVPLQRWEEIAPSPFAHIDTLRRRLVQLPVHQQLRSSDMESLITVLDTVLKRAA